MVVGSLQSTIPSPSVAKLETRGDFLRITDCLTKSWDQINQCYDEFIASFSEGKNVNETLAALEQARAASTEVENNCHPMAHAIGRYTLNKYGNVGDAFEACDFTCHSGCYHGVMERLFFSEEEIAAGSQHLSLDQMKERVAGICDRSQFSNPSNAIIFQCLHGLGHAILYTLDYDLEDALLGCDLLETPYERSSCYGGVVMENVTAFEREKRYIKKDDPHYPCNMLDQKYQYSCYQMQTSIMTEIGIPASEMGKVCMEAGEGNIGACHVSIGRDLSNYVRSGNAEYVAGICEQTEGVDEDYSLNCIEGTIYALIDNTWDSKYAYSFCNVLQKEGLKISCYRSAASYLDIYEYTYQSKLEQCDKFAGENVEICKENTF